MRVTCPCCATDFPLEAGMIDADGKRLAALLAAMDATLGRAVIGYLRLFKPAKTALRTVRAVRIVADLDALVRIGTVCADERAGIRRPALPATWAAGIEQLLASPPSGLPLTNHNYLRRVVFDLADRADAAAERSRHDAARNGQHRYGPSPAAPREDPLTSQLAYLRQMFDYGRMTREEYEQQCNEARAKFGE
jgi:hypothetical protein